MPKHVLTFKNLIATSHTHRDDRTPRERGVNDLLEASRAQARAVRDRPPHIPPGGEGRWNMATTSTLPMVAAGEQTIHPAELLRRAQLAQRQASRSVAGPAPPMSWRNVQNSEVNGGRSTSIEIVRRPVKVDSLQRAADFFGVSASAQSTRIGTGRLVEHCLRAVLEFLENEALISAANEEESKLCDLMREQVGYLDTHLKEGLLRASSLLLPGDPRRLSDISIRAILARQDADGVGQTEGDGDESFTLDWDDPTSSLISHLPLTSHPGPVSLLRELKNSPSLALTSLNLAYSTVSSLDLLVKALPVGLRELSFCGLRIKGENILSEHDANRALGVLSLKLIVLRSLDLSEPPFEITPYTLPSMIDSSSGRLPSLRRLGLRGVVPSENSEKTADHAARDVTIDPRANGKGTRYVIAQARKGIMESIRRDGKQRYIDIIWD